MNYAINPFLHLFVVLFSDIPFLSYFSIRKSDAQRANKTNFFEKYAAKTQNNRNQGTDYLWFVRSIYDAFNNTMRDLVKSRQGKAN